MLRPESASIGEVGDPFTSGVTNAIADFASDPQTRKAAASLCKPVDRQSSDRPYLVPQMTIYDNAKPEENLCLTKAETQKTGPQPSLEEQKKQLVKDIKEQLALPVKTQLELPNDATEQQVKEKLEKIRSHMGLPANATEQQLLQSRILEKLTLGLKPGDTEDKVEKAIKDLGLPADAKFKQVYDASVRKQLGLAPNASDQEVKEALQKQKEKEMNAPKETRSTKDNLETVELEKRLQLEAPVRKQLGLANDATAEQVKEKLQKLRDYYGPPGKNATDDDLLKWYVNEKVLQLGIPPHATEKEVEEARAQIRKRHGLPADATYEDLQKKFIANPDEFKRVELGLPLDTSEKDLAAAQWQAFDKRFYSQAASLRKYLELPANATFKEIDEALKKRIAKQADEKKD